MVSDPTTSSRSLLRGVSGISVNVRLCGSIPRKDMVIRASAEVTEGGAPCELPPISQEALNGPVFASTNGPAPTLTKIAATAPATSTNDGDPRRHCPSDNSTHATTFTSSSSLTLVDSCQNSSQPSTAALPNISAMARGILTDRQQTVLDATNQNGPLAAAGIVLEPPLWAVPASGESRLEPVCDSIGRQSAVDLTTRACFRVGRSPNSDVQLLHATSSRRHALLFHHENGSCYVVDCGSAHGTYVNGVRIPSPGATANAFCNGGQANGMVVPHKVKRGALIRFGGPGAPIFLLKSFNFKLDEIRQMVPPSVPLTIPSPRANSSSSAPASAVVASSEPDKGELVRRNTRINALGRTAASKVRDALFLTIDMALSVTRKRSFDSLDSRDTLDTALLEENEPLMNKRLRCSSPPPSPEEPPLRLVSPDLPQAIVRCVGSVCHRTKRVSFSTEPPTLFYPASVTPDEPSIEGNNSSSAAITTCSHSFDEETSYPHCLSSS